MPSPIKHRAVSTNSGRTRNDESTHRKTLSPSEHGKRAPMPAAGKRGGRAPTAPPPVPGQEKETCWGSLKNPSPVR
ncbi:hypothetical protein OOT46_18240 [Aquabacterium sp. A7-Y]|uniref:hypothetical protein n=1 Tax=Aquabacterium sp. A7-Y TaxID=1349605 RepID=UPI00223D30FB|nr:hypothetical protein [Aquabacterium sp. A7-Y]MCW7539777.1 hypothetical protein [Aquabacterium sp. A7-Y]